MAIGGATLVDAIDLRDRRRRDGRHRRPERRRQIDAAAAAVRRPRAVSGTVRLEAARSARLLAAPARAASRDAVAACQRQLPLHGRGDRADGRRRPQPRRRRAAGRRRACTKSGWTISAIANCRRCPAASSSARISPACWSSSPAARPLHGPGLLLLDEPTSSLDLRHQIDLVETARRRAAERHRRGRDPARSQSGGALRRPHRAAASRQACRSTASAPRRSHPRPSARSSRSMSPSTIPTAACRSCCRRPCGRSPYHPIGDGDGIRPHAYPTASHGLHKTVGGL